MREPPRNLVRLQAVAACPGVTDNANAGGIRMALELHVSDRKRRLKTKKNLSILIPLNRLIDEALRPVFVPKSHEIWHNYWINDGHGPGMDALNMSFAIEHVVPIATWLRMSEKAEREGLKAFRINDNRRSWVVTSHSQDGVAYEVTILDGDLLCSCRGSSFHPYCKHRALVLQELGILDDEDAGEPLVPDHVMAALSAA